MAEFKISSLRFTWKGVWNNSTTYNRDAVVSYNGKTYVCLVPHTSGSGDSAFYDALHAITGGAITPYWNLVINGREWKGVWTDETYFSVGNIVAYGGALYICNTEHTSSGTLNISLFDVYSEFSKWNNSWASSTAYGIGDIVKYGGIVYSCVLNHVSSATTNIGLEPDLSKWEIVNNGVEFVGTWTSASYRYRKNDLVKKGPNIWICGSGHTSSTIFDQTKWTIWIPGIDYTSTWSGGTIYQTGEVVEYGGYSYTSLTANNSGNIPSTDSTDWEVLTQG